MEGRWFLATTHSSSPGCAYVLELNEIGPDRGGRGCVKRPKLSATGRPQSFSH